MPIYKVNGAKKDGLQKYNVRINYVTASGQSKQITRVAYGAEVAKELERQLTVDVKAKTENPEMNMTIKQLSERFMLIKKYEIRESSLERYERSYRLHILPTMENIKLKKLTVSVLEDWKLLMESKGLSIKSKKHTYGDFRAMLNYAVKMEYLTINPLLKIGNFKDTLSVKKEMSIFTAEQFTKYINTAKLIAEERQAKHHDLSEWDYYVFFNIAFYTGLRKGEIHALKWSDINGSLLHVRRSITQKLKGEDRETAPKNVSSMRALQIPTPLLEVLSEHRKRQEQLKNFTNDYRVCGAERCLRDTSLQNKNIQYAKLSGLDVISIHDYRHSHVSVLANEGINIQEIARRLGHARVEMTWNTYSHLYPREEEKAVDVLNKIA
ncbi:MAG: site-specific integrase [Oscillospiraceae bacterium]|jgi:integrase|nr:site-specific integrase [Oscillospiraceae bacterium]